MSEQPRTSDGRYSFKPAGAPAGALEAPDEPRTIGPESLFAVLRAMTRREAGAGADLDDLVQDAAVAVLTTYGNGEVPLAPLRAVVRHTVSRSRGHTNLGSRDRAAMEVLRRRVEQAEGRLGRTLAPREVDELARQVRQEWPDAKHRPSVNFLERARMGVTDRLEREDGSVVDGEPAWGGSGESAEPGSALAEVEEALRDRRRDRARASAWDAYAEIHGGPRVVRGSLSAQTRTWCRQVMEVYPGGVLGAVDAWRRAEDDEGTEALFAPFGGIDEGGRDAVCAMLAHKPHLAEELWEAALSASVRR